MVIGVCRLTAADVEFVGDVFDASTTFNLLGGVDRYVRHIVVDLRLEEFRKRPLVLSDQRLEWLEHITRVEQIFAEPRRRRHLVTWLMA